jgi:hypothetical protein
MGEANPLDSPVGVGLVDKANDVIPERLLRFIFFVNVEGMEGKLLSKEVDSKRTVVIFCPIKKLNLPSC